MVLESPYSCTLAGEMSAAGDEWFPACCGLRGLLY